MDFSQRLIFPKSEEVCWKIYKVQNIVIFLEMQAPQEYEHFFRNDNGKLSPEKKVLKACYRRAQTFKHPNIQTLMSLSSNLIFT
jgi:hypothetical protein